MATPHNKPAPKKAKTKPLARLKATNKGEIAHIEVHPAKNSAGGRAFRTLVHRKRPKMHEDMLAKGHYVPPPEPEETVHEDWPDAVDHMGRAYGVQQEPDGDEGEEGEEV